MSTHHEDLAAETEQLEQSTETAESGVDNVETAASTAASAEERNGATSGAAAPGAASKVLAVEDIKLSAESIAELHEALETVMASSLVRQQQQQQQPQAQAQTHAPAQTQQQQQQQQQSPQSQLRGVRARPVREKFRVNRCALLCLCQ